MAIETCAEANGCDCGWSDAFVRRTGIVTVFFRDQTDEATCFETGASAYRVGRSRGLANETFAAMTVPQMMNPFQLTPARLRLLEIGSAVSLRHKTKCDDTIHRPRWNRH
jgi:hypothetical protein